MSTPKTETKPAAATKPNLPNLDFDADISEAPIDCWYDSEAAQPFIGQVVGHKVITTDNGPSDVVIVKLLHDATAIVEKEPTEVKTGATMGVFISYKLQPLLELVEHKCIVRVTPTGKKKLKGGKTMREYKIEPKKGSKLGAPPAAAISKTAAVAPDVDRGDADDFA